jgi:hypothetical protein
VDPYQAVPRAAAGAAAGTIVENLQLEGVGLVAHDDACARRTCVFESVLLDDPVRGHVDTGRQLDRRAFDAHVGRQAGRRDLCRQTAAA